MTIDQRAIDWILSGDTGTSSETIWGVMMGGTKISFADIPYDPSDFGRCYRLLKKIPEWAVRLSEVADAFPKWEPFVGAWPDLERIWIEESPSRNCPKLYALMQELRS